MKKIKKILLIATAILLTQQSVEGIIFLCRSGCYLAGSASFDWNTSNKSFLTVDTAPSTISGRIRPDDGFNANLAIGFYLNQWRLEAEGNYRNKKGNANFSSGGVTVTDFGYLSQYSVMANAYYDIPLCCDWGFYLGGGVGAAFSEIETTGIINASQSDARFAAQLMAGTFYNITRCIILTFGYRIFATTAPKDYTFSNDLATATVSGEGSPITQSIELGLRIPF